MQDEYRGMEGTRPYHGVAALYAQHRGKLSETMVGKVAGLLGWRRDDRILDLGSGPGQLALRFAGRVGEVVCLDIEPDMVAEGRRQAAVLGAGNVTFLNAGSDDLAELAPKLGQFRAVMIGEAFHWMLDRDRVLRDLSSMVDAKAGAVVLISTAKEVGASPTLKEAERTVRRLLKEHTEGVPERPHPRGRHDPFEDILARSAFPVVEHLEHIYDLEAPLRAEDLIGWEYTISHVLARLGQRREAFEQAVRQALEGFDGHYGLRRVRDEAIIGQRRETPLPPSS